MSPKSLVVCSVPEWSKWRGSNRSLWRLMFTFGASDTHSQWCMPKWCMMTRENHISSQWPLPVSFDVQIYWRGCRIDHFDRGKRVTGLRSGVLGLSKFTFGHNPNYACKSRSRDQDQDCVKKLIGFRRRTTQQHAKLYVIIFRLIWFLADRTNGRAYATVLRLSVCLSVTLCIVAKRCVLEQKLLWRAYRKSYMRNRLVPKWMILTFV